MCKLKGVYSALLGGSRKNKGAPNKLGEGFMVGGEGIEPPASSV
jgi:hypothetical protein